MPSLRTRLSVAALLLFSLVSVGTIGVTSEVAPAAAAVAPTRTISVSGTGVAMYPAFSATTTRYGITTTALTAGTVTVDASTSDPAGRVWVDGQPEVGGTATLTGLSSGAEISIFIKDSAGTTAYALIYLPVGFPAMTATTKLAGTAPGDVFLTLSDFTGTTPSYETVIDNNGVPIYVRTDTGVPTDFKLQPNGDYSVFRQPTPTPGRFGGQIVELNGAFKQVAAYETAKPLVYTDGHDAILLPNGDRWLMSTVPNSAANDTDDVIQEQGPNGKVLFSWNTADHPNQFNPTLDGLSGTGDYAHLNSLSLTANGDIVASFRHTSQVMQIATSAHNGFTSGDVEWTLGGRRPTLSFINPANDPFKPDNGPCAQHDASVLPNGDILMFDDGSESIGGSEVLCPNPQNPSGPAIARPQSRVTEYSINQKAKTATLVWSYVVPGLDSNFAGSAQRLTNGDTFIGWGGTHAGLASEVTAKGQVLWALSDAPSNLISYRAFRFRAPDEIHPAVVVSQPADGATYAFGQHVSNSFSCTDRGGSTLQSCAGSVAEGGPINTSWPGTHTFTVVAKDGAGNTTTVTRTYHVGPAPYQPDAQIKAAGAGAFKGNNTYAYAGVAKQDIKQAIAKAGKSAVATVRIQNDGTRTDRITLHGTAGTAKFRVSYFVGTANVTKRVTAGTYKTPSLASGKTFTLRITVTRTAKAKPGTSRTVTLSGTSAHDPSMHDSVATIVRAIR